MFKRPLLSQLLILVMLGFPGQAIAQKRPTPKPKPAAKPVPPITFENLVSADSYKIYVEVRNVGQLISSSSVNEMIEPVMKLAAPPKEFKTAVKWLTAHADAVTTSRMLVAAWPTGRNIPDVFVAVEFDTAEEAAKFESQLKEVLPKVLPPTKSKPTPSKPDAEPTKPPASTTPTPQTGGANAVTVPQQEAVPSYYISRSASLVFVTNAPLTLKNLRPPNSKPLVEDQNFRTAYDRFSAESIFAYVNIKAIELEENERRQKSIEERKKAEEEAATAAAAANKPPEGNEETSPDEEPPPPAPVEESNATSTITAVAVPSAPDPMSIAMTQLTGALFSGLGGEPKWPEGIGLALTLDSSSFDVRALLVSQGEKPCAIPFIPLLASGPPLIPESPSILPADTELFVTTSLDLPQIYAAMAKSGAPTDAQNVVVEHTETSESTSPFAFFETKLGMKFDKDLLPLLGNEIVFSMPVEKLDAGPPSAAAATPTPEASSSGPYADAAAKMSSPVFAISLRDKEAIRSLLPKLIEGLGFKGANMVAATERREDTEIVSYADVASYAFIGNFLVLSSDVKNVRHVVDSYLKRETLSSDINFRNFTRWQPRQLQGQVYVSPSLMESYKKWANESTSVMSEQMREFLTRLTVTAEPVTYSISNEGNGPLHQLRIPRNLVVMAVAGMSAGTNVTPEMMNERITIGALYSIANAEMTHKSEKGSYLPLEELVTQKTISREQLEGHGYKIYVNMVGDGFEAVAVPLEYGKTGTLSYFVNETMIMRSGDHGGAPATVADKPMQ